MVIQAYAPTSNTEEAEVAWTRRGPGARAPFRPAPPAWWLRARRRSRRADCQCSPWTTPTCRSPSRSPCGSCWPPWPRSVSAPDPRGWGRGRGELTSGSWPPPRDPGRGDRAASSRRKGPSLPGGGVWGEQLYALVLVELGLEIAPELQPVTNLAIRCFLCLACRVTALWQSGDLLIAGGGEWAEIWGLTYWEQGISAARMVEALDAWRWMRLGSDADPGPHCCGVWKRGSGAPECLQHDRVSGKGALCLLSSGPRLESDSSPGSIFLVTKASEASCMITKTQVSKTTLNSHLEIYLQIYFLTFFF